MYYPEFNATNLFITATLIIGTAALVLREFNPESRLHYSKFNLTTGTKKLGSRFQIPSRYGMLVTYLPALFVSIYLVNKSYCSFCVTTNRLFFIAVISLCHYLKRVFEVLFVHRYSGRSSVVDNASIAVCYVVYCLSVYECAKAVPTSKFDLLSSLVGFTLYFLGEGFNLYHHLILRNLRKSEGDTEYKIPYHGFFKYVWCPHYTGEIITFIAVVVIIQHFYILLLQLSSACYLATRAYNTKQWYEEKFRHYTHFPKRHYIFPYLF